MSTDDGLLRVTSDGVVVYAASGYLEDDDVLSRDFPASVMQAVADRVRTGVAQPYLTRREEWDLRRRPPGGFAQVVPLVQAVRDSELLAARTAVDAGSRIVERGGALVDAAAELDAVCCRIRAAHVANLVGRLDPPERRIVRVLQLRGAPVAELSGPDRAGTWILELGTARVRCRFVIRGGVPEPALVAVGSRGGEDERLPFDVVLRAWIADRSRRSIPAAASGPGVNALLTSDELAAVVDYAESDPEHLRVLRREQIARHHAGYVADPLHGMDDAAWRAVFDAR